MLEEQQVFFEEKTFFARYTAEKDGKLQTNATILKADSMREDNGFLRVYRRGALVAVYDMAILQMAQLKDDEKERC